MQIPANLDIQIYLFPFEIPPMLSAPSSVRFTAASLSLLIAFSQHPARAIETSNALSWTSGSIGYYETFSPNNPVVRKVAKNGDNLATALDAKKDILNDVKRVNQGVSREQVLTGTIVKYSSLFTMKAAIGAAAELAAPLCAISLIVTFGCVGAFLIADQVADNSSNKYRAWVESLFNKDETQSSENVECGSMEYYSRVGGSGCGTEQQDSPQATDQGFNGVWRQTQAGQEGMVLKVTDGNFSLTLGKGMESCGTIKGTFSLMTADEIAGSFGGRCGDLNMKGKVGMQRKGSDYSLTNCVSMASRTPGPCSLGYFADAERAGK